MNWLSCLRSASEMKTSILWCKLQMCVIFYWDFLDSDSSCLHSLICLLNMSHYKILRYVLYFLVFTIVITIYHLMICFSSMSHRNLLRYVLCLQVHSIVHQYVSLLYIVLESANIFVYVYVISFLLFQPSRRRNSYHEASNSPCN